MSDTVSFKEQKEILAGLVVSGFIRSTTKGTMLPIELINECTTFYFVLNDEWDQSKINPSILTINEGKNDIRCGIWNSPGGLPMPFGTITVGKGDIQSWKIKVVETSDVHHEHAFINEQFVFLGICEASKAIELKDDPTDKPFTYYGCGYSSVQNLVIAGPGNASKEYGIEWKKDDIVEMILDMTGHQYGTLSYKVNKEDQGIAWGDIDINKEYCMALMIQQHATIRILCE